MNDKRSIFFNEWQACLRAHYQTVIQDNDVITEPTLRAVLLQSGIPEDELHTLAEKAHTGTPRSEEKSPDESAEDQTNGQMALF